MSDLVRCYICQNEPQPRVLMHEHHRVPTSCGGPDTVHNRCWLHSGCHNNIHRLADKLRAGKNGETESMAAMIYATNAAKKRALELAQLIARSFTIPSTTSTSDDNKVQISIEVPGTVYAALRLLAEDRRQTRYVFGCKTNQSRAVGVGRLVTGIVVNYLREKGYYKPNPL